MTNKQTIDSVSRTAIQFAIERLDDCQNQAFQSCECEECEQCGEMPDKCSGTECAKTCQCITCDHCSNKAATEELRAFLDKPAIDYVLINGMHFSHAEILEWREKACADMEKAAQTQGEPVPITCDMSRLMEAYRLGEFDSEGGSNTVEALSVASFDSVESRGHDADSYMAGFCAAMYEQAKPFIWLAMRLDSQGEVERLRERVKELEADESEWSAKQQKLGDENEALRARLDGQDALLREVTDKCNIGFNMRNRLLSALSTSAEPKPRGEAVAWLDQESGAIVTAKLKSILGKDGFEIPLYTEPSHSGDANEMVAKVVLPTLKVEPSEDDAGSDIFDLDWVHDRAMAFGYNEAINEVAKLNGMKP